MAVMVHSSPDTAAVVSVTGVADARLIASVVGMLVDGPDERPIVLDLSEVSLVDRDTVRAVTRLMAHPRAHRVRVVCGRLTARRMLRRFGDPALPVFASVDGALARPVAC